MKLRDLDNSHNFHIGITTVDSNCIFTPGGKGRKQKKEVRLSLSLSYWLLGDGVA